MLYEVNTKLTGTDAELDFEWIGHPRSFRDDHPIGARRRDLIIVARIDDDQADYSFDDWALVQLDDQYYLLETSGCSCPSPTEEGSVVEGPCSLDEMEAKIESSIAHDKYGIVFRQADQFRKMIRFARRT